jgi:predicted metal-dependent hydrolase
MNHSKDFYLELESMMSDYKQKEKWLKQNWNFL